MKYKVVLFDADGVTLKDEGLFSEKLEEQGLIPSVDKTKTFFKGVFQDCLLGKADLKEELAKVIGDWGWQGTVDEIIEFWFSIGDDLNQDVAKYISELKKNGIVCYMTTDQEKYRGQYLRAKLGKIFEGFFISGEIGHKKKELEYFEYVYEEIKNKVKDKSEILFIDDDEKNVEKAWVFGVEAIHFRTIADLPELKF